MQRGASQIYRFKLLAKWPTVFRVPDGQPAARHQAFCQLRDCSLRHFGCEIDQYIPAENQVERDKIVGQRWEGMPHQIVIVKRHALLEHRCDSPRFPGQRLFETFAAKLGRSSAKRPILILAGRSLREDGAIDVRANNRDVPVIERQLHFPTKQK